MLCHIQRAMSIRGRNHKGELHLDRKSTRLNSSHDQISYAVFCLKKKKNTINHSTAELREVLALTSCKHRLTQTDSHGMLQQRSITKPLLQQTSIGMFDVPRCVIN